MNTTDLKKLLKDEIELGLCLIDLVEQCFKEIFPEEADCNNATWEFKSYLENFYENACLGSMSSYKSNVASARERRENWRREQEKKEKQKKGE